MEEASEIMALRTLLRRVDAALADNQHPHPRDAETLDALSSWWRDRRQNSAPDLDGIAAAISDSLGPDWTPMDGALAVADFLNS